MRRKFRIAFAAAAVMLNTAVFAAELDAPVFNRDNGTITVSGMSGQVGNVTIEVLRPGFEWEDLQNTQNAAEQMGKLAYIAQISTDSEGKFSLNFVLIDAPSGVYPVRIYSYGDKQALTNDTGLRIYREEDIEALISRICAEDADKLADILLNADNAQMLDIDISPYIALDGERLARIFYNEAKNGDVKKPSDVETVLEKSKFVLEINDADAEGLGALLNDENLALIGVKGGNAAYMYDIYVDSDCFSAGHRKQLLSALAAQDYKDTKDLMQRFADRVLCIACRGQSNYHNIEKVLTAVKGNAELDFGRFFSLSNNSDVLKALNSMSAPYNSAQELAKAVKELSAGTGGNGGGSSGGGSPGRGSYKSKSPDVNMSVTPSGDIGKKTVFADMGGYEWAADAVETLRKQNIISGKSDTSYCPGDIVTREEFTKMLISAAAVDISLGAMQESFADAPEGAWYNPYVKTASSIGIVSGIGEGIFGVGMPITRQDMAVMAARILEYCGIECSGSMSFSDSSDIADYAKAAVGSLGSAGVISGTGNGAFEPMGIVNRAQAARMVYELYLKIQEGRK